MGYYTQYKLSVIQGDVDYNELRTQIEKSSDYWLLGDDCIETCDEVKWYDWQEDMEAFSKTRPDLVFRLEGIGEETGDFWCAYFKNGKWNFIS